jgi:hypothetical protein
MKFPHATRTLLAATAFLAAGIILTGGGHADEVVEKFFGNYVGAGNAVILDKSMAISFMRLQDEDVKVRMSGDLVRTK